MKKEGKIYLYDWTEVADPGARLKTSSLAIYSRLVIFGMTPGVNFELCYVLAIKKSKRLIFCLFGIRSLG